jgi:hypothetical protein
LERRETTEQKISEERTNKFKFLYQEHGYNPSIGCRIRKSRTILEKDKGVDVMKKNGDSDLIRGGKKHRDVTAHLLELVSEILG